MFSGRAETLKLISLQWWFLNLKELSSNPTVSQLLLFSFHLIYICHIPVLPKVYVFKYTWAKAFSLPGILLSTNKFAVEFEFVWPTTYWWSWGSLYLNESGWLWLPEIFKGCQTCPTFWWQKIEKVCDPKNPILFGFFWVGIESMIDGTSFSTVLPAVYRLLLRCQWLWSSCFSANSILFGPYISL